MPSPGSRTVFGRVRRVQMEMRSRGMAGRWVPGTYLGPGIRNHHARMNHIWGPDGIVIIVVRPSGQASVKALRLQGVRRPVVVQEVAGPNSRREVVRMELSDFLDMLAGYTQWLAQQGRLGQDE